jgi:2'-5' RNA ligase
VTRPAGLATIRAFVAMDLDEPMRERVGALAQSLRRAFPAVRWVRPEGIHLTLRFFGACTEGQIEGLKSRLSALAAQAPVTRAPVAGLGIFPERGQPRVLWLGLAVERSVVLLQGSCEAAAVGEGFAGEGRDFRPHLTLGRWRDHAPRPPLPPVDLGVATLETLTFYRSQTGPGGSRYTPLDRWHLGAG